MATLNANQAYTYTASATCPSPFNGPYTYQWAFDGVNAGTSSTQAKTWTSLGPHTTTCLVTNTATTDSILAREVDVVTGTAEGTGSSTISSFFMGIALGNANELVLMPGTDSATFGGGNMPSNSWLNSPPNNHAVVYSLTGDTFTASTGSFGLSTDTFTSGGSIALRLQDGTIFVVTASGGGTNWERKCFAYNYSTQTITAKPNHPSTSTLPFNEAIISNILPYHVMLLPSGKVFTQVYQGSGATSTATWLYDPGTSTWSSSVPVPFQPQTNTYMRCVVDQSTGYVYAYGAFDSGSVLRGYVYRWKEGDVSWTFVGTDPLPRYNSLMAANNGKLMVLGGVMLAGPNYSGKCYVLDGNAGTWVQLADWPEAICYGTPPVVDGNKAYIWGYKNPLAPAIGVYAGYYNITAGAGAAPSTVSLSAHYRTQGNALYIPPGGSQLYSFGGFSDVFLTKMLSVYLA